MSRRRIAYLLTKRGIVFANELIESFKNKIILVRTLKNELKEIKLRQMEEYLGFYVSPLMVYKHFQRSKNNENVIDLKQIKADKKKIKHQRKSIKTLIDMPAISHPKQNFIFSNEVPIIEDFSGRENEHENIKD